MNTQHIGAAGELVVPYQLVKLGIDSARLTTDAGVDLVFYAPGDQSARTVQVKANLGPKPSGGRGPLSRSWYFPHHCPAQLIALAALDTDTVWLFTLDEARSLAQQHSDRGIRQLYWRREPSLPGAAAPRHEGQMHTYLLATRAPQMFPAWASGSPTELHDVEARRGGCGSARGDSSGRSVRVGGERITRAKGVRSDEARLDLRCPAKDPSPNKDARPSRQKRKSRSGAPTGSGCRSRSLRQ